MLIDDDAATNYIHRRVISESGLAEKITVKDRAEDALDVLLEEAEEIPELIFLDINMPGMDGWEFLDSYSRFLEKVENDIVLIMMTTSINPDDEKKARSLKQITDFQSKPLNSQKLKDIIATYF